MLKTIGNVEGEDFCKDNPISVINSHLKVLLFRNFVSLCKW